MNALPYVDQLFREYLLFRGFTGTLQAFNGDLANDKGQGVQVCPESGHSMPTCNLGFCIPHDLVRVDKCSCKSSLKLARPKSSYVLQADQITSLVFSKLIRQGRGRELLDLLDFLNARVYSRLGTAYESTIRKLRVRPAVCRPASHLGNCAMFALLPPHLK